MIAHCKECILKYFPFCNCSIRNTTEEGHVLNLIFKSISSKNSMGRTIEPWDFQNRSFHILLLISTILAGLYCEWVFHVKLGITTVYSHLFYFPIILSAMYYDLKGGLCCGLFFALIHTFPITKGFHAELALSGLSLVLVGATLGYSHEKVVHLRKTMEDSKRILANIVENTGLSSIIVERGTGQVLFANEQFCKKMELHKKDAIGTSNWFSFINSEDRQLCEKARELIRTGEISELQFECRATPKNGLMMEILVNVARLDPGNAAMISFLDITEKNHLAQEEKFKRIMFETLFENSPGALAVIDQGDHILNVNQSFLGTFHIPSKEKILGMDLGNVLLQENDADLRKEFYEVFTLPSGKSRIERDTYRRRYDGTLIPVHIIEVPVKLGEKNVYYTLYQDISERIHDQQELQSAYEYLADSMEQLIMTISRIIEYRDPYTAGHQQRVAELASAIATEQGMDEKAIRGIYVGGLLHDIGKIQIPAEILSKPGKLTDLEFNLIRQHPEIACQILEGIHFPWPVHKMIRHHHERLDGSGYPDQLKGNSIPLEARVLAVADVVEAMMNHRPYRPALGITTALEEVQREAGNKFDPSVVETCVRLFIDHKFRFSV